MGNFGRQISRISSFDVLIEQDLSIGYNYFNLSSAYVINNQSGFYVGPFSNLDIAACPTANTLYDLKTTGILVSTFLSLSKVDPSTSQRLCINIIYDNDYLNHKNVVGLNKTFTLFGLFDITLKLLNYTIIKTITINKIKYEIMKGAFMYQNLSKMQI